MRIEKKTDTIQYASAFIAIFAIRPFPSSSGPLCQNEVKCSAFDMEIIFHSHANKTNFHKRGCALGLISKVRGFGTRKWPIKDHFLSRRHPFTGRWSFLP